MECKKCKGPVKIIKGYISNMNKKDDVIKRCGKCGYIENIVLECEVYDDYNKSK